MSKWVKADGPGKDCHFRPEMVNHVTFIEGMTVVGLTGGDRVWWKDKTPEQVMAMINEAWA